MANGSVKHLGFRSTFLPSIGPFGITRIENNYGVAEYAWKGAVKKVTGRLFQFGHCPLSPEAAAATRQRKPGRERDRLGAGYRDGQLRRGVAPETADAHRILKKSRTRPSSALVRSSMARASLLAARAARWDSS